MNTLDTKLIVKLHDKALDEWYSVDTAPLLFLKDWPEGRGPGDTLDSVVLAQHYCNFSVWNLEDQARRTDVEDAYIAKIKRHIDVWNQKRNDGMEQIDEFVLNQLGDVDLDEAELHSETPGIMVDRLSILSLKIRHMGHNASREDDPEVAEECKGKLNILRIQRADLCQCIDELLAGMKKGHRYFKIYRQFKQYNDPRLNPAVRAAGQGD